MGLISLPKSTGGAECDRLPEGTAAYASRQVESTKTGMVSFIGSTFSLKKVYTRISDVQLRFNTFATAENLRISQ